MIELVLHVRELSVRYAFQSLTSLENIVRELRNPDSLLPLYIAFLAYDNYIADSAHITTSSALEGVSTASAAPGNQEVSLSDSEEAEPSDEDALLEHAMMVLTGLWRENGEDTEEDLAEKNYQGEEDEDEPKDLRTRVKEFTQEL